jgi:murein DD-endopeptidase MepM/ murein hydrolase activator NlpD
MIKPVGMLAVVVTLASGLAWSAAVRGENAAISGVSLDLEIGRVLAEIQSDDLKQSQVQQQVQQLDTQRAQLLVAIKPRLRALYRLTRPEAAPVAAGFAAMRGHLARVRRLKGLVENDVGALEAAAVRCTTIRAQAAAAATELVQAREHLEALRGQSALATSFAAATDPTPQTTSDSGDHGFYGLRFSAGQPRSEFEKLRGRLATPVTGEVRLSDLPRTGTEGPALSFAAQSGTAVRAVAAGRIAFSDRQAGYGRLVIVDHGAGYYTAYGGLGSVEVRVGDDVSASARLGDIGGDGQDPALIFEVRKGNRALPPRTWLGL